MLTPRLDMVFIYTCNGKYSKKDIKRFLKYIRINRETGCWGWTGALDRHGYGQFSICRNYIQNVYHVYRMAYEMSTGKVILGGIYICHHCDNRKCCNPDHLFTGTHQDNMDDMVSKNRQSRMIGEKHPMAKLTLEIVEEIRELYVTRKYTMKRLADKFNISYTTINYVVNNKTWRINATNS